MGFQNGNRFLERVLRKVFSEGGFGKVVPRPFGEYDP